MESDRNARQHNNDASEVKETTEYGLFLLEAWQRLKSQWEFYELADEVIDDEQVCAINILERVIFEWWIETSLIDLWH